MSRALATALLGLALTLAAAAFDSASLYVPGLALGAIGLVAGAWVWLAARGASVVRVPGPKTIQEEEPYPLRVEVRAGALPPPGGELVEPLLGWPVPIAGRWSRRVRINVRFERRGRRRLEPSLLVIRDPLRLAVRRVLGASTHELLVLPRIEPVLAAGSGGGAAGSSDGAEAAQGEASGGLTGSAAELELDSLRPYRPGTPASRIHWPAVARTGTMLERRLIAGGEARPLVVLDPRRPVDGEALDRAVRATASLCVHLARSGGCGILLPGERRPVEIARDLAAWPAVHARLALVEADSGSPALPRGLRVESVFWVTADGSSRIPRQLERMTGVRHLVTPTPTSGARVAFKVAGCSGHLLSRTAARAGRGTRRAA